MSRKAAILLGLAVVGLALGAGWEFLGARKVTEPVREEQGPPPESRQPAGELFFPEPTANLGLIEKERTHEFVFENRGTRSVHVRGVHTSCSCVVGEPERKVYQPGEKGKFSVTVVPRAGGPTNQSFSLTLAYDGEQPREAQLRLTVRWRQDVVVASSISLRAVSGKEAAASFDLVDYRDESLTVSHLTTSAADLTAEVVEKPVSFLPGWRHRLRLCYAGTRPPGRYGETVTLHTSDPARRTLAVSVVLQVERRVRVSPETLYLTRDADGRIASGKVYLDDREGDPVEVVGMKSSDSRLNAEVKVTRPSQAVVSVRFSFGETKPGAKSDPVMLRVQLKKPVSEEICVRVVP